MKRLLQIEWQKLYNYRLARVFFIIYFFLLLVLSVGLAQEFTLFGKPIRLQDQGFYSFPLVYNFLTYVNSYLKIFLAFVVISTVVSEFSNRTFKQNLIDGLSRKEWLVSKVGMIFILCAVSTVVVGILCLVYGFANPTQLDVTAWTQMEFLLLYFLENLSFLLFVLFLSIVIRKAIFAFLILFIWKIVETLITALLSYALKDPAQPLEKMKAFHFLPLDVQGNLIVNPALRSSLAKMLDIGTEYQFPTLSFILVLVYSVGFIGLSFWVLKRRDW